MWSWESLDKAASSLQVVIVPILKKNTDTEAVLKAADDLAKAATSAGIRAKVDAGTEKTPGFKFSFWEMKACFSVIATSSHMNRLTLRLLCPQGCSMNMRETPVFNTLPAI